VLFWLTLAAALGCALVGGIFFAFSNFVMKALFRIPTQSGIAAMQAINVTVLNPLFFALFFGTAALCALLLRNNALERVDPASSVSDWRRYVQEWTWWNHVRALAAILAAAFLALELPQLKT
jgi:uncharacterized membrane protein